MHASAGTCTAELRLRAPLLWARETMEIVRGAMGPDAGSLCSSTVALKELHLAIGRASLGLSFLPPEDR